MPRASGLGARPFPPPPRGAARPGRASPRGSRRLAPRARAVEEPRSSTTPPPYRGALFPGVEVPEQGAETWRQLSRAFPWGNGAPVTEGVLGDMFSECVFFSAPPIFFLREIDASFSSPETPTVTVTTVAPSVASLASPSVASSSAALSWNQRARHCCAVRPVSIFEMLLHRGPSVS